MEWLDIVHSKWLRNNVGTDPQIRTRTSVTVVSQAGHPRVAGTQKANESAFLATCTIFSVNSH